MNKCWLEKKMKNPMTLQIISDVRLYDFFHIIDNIQLTPLADGSAFKLNFNP